MIHQLGPTTSSEVNRALVSLRVQGGAVTLGRVLTLVIVTSEGESTEQAVEDANAASREHPCRMVVLSRGSGRAKTRLDAEIRVGGDAGASEVVVLRHQGELADEGASCLVPLLLPDAPVVAWWPGHAPAVPQSDSIGRLAQRRICDAASESNPIRALRQRRKAYTEGDTDLAWTRLTSWRAVLTSALDLPPFEEVTAAEVRGEADSPSTDLLAAWLAWRLRLRVRRSISRPGAGKSGRGIVSVTLHRRSGDVELVRPSGHTGTLTQPAQPERKVALQRRGAADCLVEELRRLDPDEIYQATLEGLGSISRESESRSRS